ncbi:hypothetical protein WR164_15470 [Philodulcilactobacillus myokoensis]|uniref:Calcineurin-like phosphoesterase domain-containing protein n=1 Tax=Philodulcilactobacillus myokoensis TaxID=2929573 RepID=A0A9W6B343_9LACO|nr:metallophosphoesterase [Philodulcilactobacillus myokoensis]GLB47568.1 hypothetical protein WR164_15470 [Philodulcilactobacillus myokoensis]
MQHNIIQITDTHLKNSTGAKQMKQRFSPNEKLDLVFRDIKRHHLKADFIAITDDLIHEGNIADYCAFKKMISCKQDRLKMPIYVTLGNHDRTKAFYRGYLKQKSKDKYYYQITSSDYDYYFLDTNFNNIEQGYLDYKQLNWLGERLSQSDHPAIIFMHHLPYAPH